MAVSGLPQSEGVTDQRTAPPTLNDRFGEPLMSAISLKKSPKVNFRCG